MKLTNIKYFIYIKKNNIHIPKSGLKLLNREQYIRTNGSGHLIVLGPINMYNLARIDLLNNRLSRNNVFISNLHLGLQCAFENVKQLDVLCTIETMERIPALTHGYIVGDTNFDR